MAFPVKSSNYNLNDNSISLMKTLRKDGYKEELAIAFLFGDYLKRLAFSNFALEYIQKNGICDLSGYSGELLRLLVPAEGVEGDPELFKPILGNYPALAADQVLGTALVMKVLQLLGVARLCPPETLISVDAKQYLRGYLFIGYYLAKAFEPQLGQKGAIEAYQKIRDEFTRTVPFEKAEHVSDFVFGDEGQGAFRNAFIMTDFTLDEGRSGSKVYKCKWAEVMKELNDPDFAYAVACHYDFEAAKMYNPAFHLTRSGTLIQGCPCCDFVWHDTRIDETLTHPGKEFWDALP